MVERSNIPGRVRFEFPHLKGCLEELSQLNKEIKKATGVLSTELNSRTGRILINFNKSKTSTDQLTQQFAPDGKIRYAYSKKPTPSIIEKSKLKETGVKVLKALRKEVIQSALPLGVGHKIILNITVGTLLTVLQD